MLRFRCEDGGLGVRMGGGGLTAALLHVVSYLRSESNFIIMSFTFFLVYSG